MSAALREQKKLNLPWFTKMKTILQLVEIYSYDHVTTFQLLNPKSKLIKSTLTINPHSPLTKPMHEPVKSEKYRPPKIMEILTGIFKTKWEHQKSKSPKLSFYHSIKSSFGLEPYLESKSFKLRNCTTKLRITAHDLQVERGRYVNLPREKRTCIWCKTSLGQDFIEYESHVLFQCDLYAGLRHKLIINLNKKPSPTQDPLSQTMHTGNIVQITNSNIRNNLMSILSPNHASTRITSIIHPEQSHEIKRHSHKFNSLVQKRAYLISCICSYISRCFEERKKII